MRTSNNPKKPAEQEYCLTTFEITYYNPDHPSILQTLTLQKPDILPERPVLKQYLDFWAQEIEGPAHSVRWMDHKLGIVPPQGSKLIM